MELRFTQPASETEVPPERGSAVFDFADLLVLQLDPDAYGKALSEGLFQDDNVRGLYARARAVTEAGGSFLRLRLFVAPSAARLQALRWELLHDPETRTPVATSERTLFSRFMISRDWGSVQLRPKSDLHALVAVAAPADVEDYELADVDVDGEVRRVRDSLAVGQGNGGGTDPIAVEILGQHEPLTLDRLAARLLRGNGHSGVDILYLVCHGMLHPDQGPAVLLQDEDGNAAWVEGARLSEAVSEAGPPPRLVVLASCESAGTEDGTTLGGIGSTAEAALGSLLAAAGVPAVVAMQGKISMRTTERAMPVFFRELLRDGQIDRALAAARGAVRDRHDAWMPALYSRLERGCIWQDREGDEKQDAAAEQCPRDVTGVLLRHWPPPELPEQPYPVLLPYTHPDLMAGRGADLARLRRQLRTTVPILGLGAPSGMGKSSLLLGGLVPAMRAERLPVALGRHPQEAGVAGRLLGDLVDSADDVPDDDWLGFVERLAAVADLAGVPPLLILDQFENVLRDEAVEARIRLGVLLAATTRRRPGTDQPLCRWLLAYRIESHGELLAWLGNVLLDAKAADRPGDGIDGLPYDLSGPDRFQGLILTPLATPSPAGDPFVEASRVFQAAIEKPLDHFDYRFAPGHSERLARAFAEARLAQPGAPLGPELQVVLAHLLAQATPDGILTVPADPGELVGEALADHLRRALEAAFPSGSPDSATRRPATRRARALLALRELATATGQRDEGVDAEELATAIGEDGDEILEQLATPLTRLVVLQETPGGLHYVLSHDRMAEVVVGMTEEEGRRGKLLIDAELLRLRRFVALGTALYRSQAPSANDGSAVVATRIPRRHYRSIAEQGEVLLWDEDRRAWWAACRERRRIDRRRATVRTAVALLVLALVTWVTWSQVKRIRQHAALLAQVAEAEPDEALAALAALVDEGAEAQELLALLRRRNAAMDVLERGLGGIPEAERSTVVLRTVEIALPWVWETPDDPVLIANLVWALDYAPARDPPFAERAHALRDQVLAPLRELRPPPPLPDVDDPDWIGVPAGTFLMGSPDGEGYEDEHPRHQVTVSAFRIQRHEVTNAEYRRLWPEHEGEDDLPAAFVSWYQAYSYAAWLGGRLPTEAEWEYAARAGCHYAYCTREGMETTVDAVAWTLRNSRDPESGEAASQPVMWLEPNPWGLYDMLGNVWEWTADWFGEYTDHAQLDPSADPSGGRRVNRGGGFGLQARGSRVANRGGIAPGDGNANQGLRSVLPGGRRPGRPEPLVFDH